MDMLTQTVDRLREEISMYEAQSIAQLEETKAAQKALSEAITEIEVHAGLSRGTIPYADIPRSTVSPVEIPLCGGAGAFRQRWR